jgi:hypothetical protein
MRKTLRTFGAALATAPLLLAPNMAGAQQPASGPVCAERPKVTEALITQWGELPAVVGRTANQVMEVWLNPETGTWTLVVTSQNGVSCINAAGSDGQVIKENPVLS